MVDSPYKPPGHESFERPFQAGGNDDGREKVIEVAKYQRWVIFAVLANICLYVLILAMQGRPFPANLIVPAVALPVVIFMIAAIFMLTRRLINTGVAVLFSVLMFVPCVSLIVLLVVNQMATAFLQSSGVKVGFFGVNPNSI